MSWKIGSFDPGALLKKAEQGATDLVNTVKADTSKVVNTVKADTTAVVNTVKADATNAVNTVKTDVSDFVTTVKADANKAVNAVKADANKAVDAFEKKKDQFGQFLSAHNITIPGLAKSADDQYDGALLGPTNAGHPNGVYPPGTDITTMPAIMPAAPKAGVDPNDRVLFINGILTSKQGEVDDMKAIANATGIPVIGIHNSTDGFAGDTLQTGADKINQGDNKAVDSTKQAIIQQLEQGHTLHIMGHSQGGLVVARAIADARPELKAFIGKQTGVPCTDDHDPRLLKLLSNLHVEDFGTAASNYPDGPRYDHYINTLDPVVNTLGIGNKDLPDWHPGAGAKMHYIPGTLELNVVENHDLTKYMAARGAGTRPATS